MNKLDRPKRWTSKEGLFVCEKKYDMLKLHRFIKRCVKGTSASVRKFVIKKNLLEHGYLGLAIFHEEEIMIQENESQIDFLTTLLHEVFHFYFRDGDDDRDYGVVDSDDPIEIRAEKSARNMLKWYIDNEKRLLELLQLLKATKSRKLTKKERENL